MTRQRVRIQFAKEGDLRLISHRDLMRTWERLFRRAGVAVCMTEGFHPKPKMMFPSALAVGIEGLDEVLEIELPEDRDLDPLAELLRSHAPNGLVIHGIVPSTGRNARLRGMTFRVAVPVERREQVRERLAWLGQQETYRIAREGRATPIDLVPLIEELRLDDDGTLEMRLRVAADGGARPREVLEALGLAEIESLGIVLRRTAVELSPT